jgi:hypothetical protein
MKKIHTKAIQRLSKHSESKAIDKYIGAIIGPVQTRYASQCSKYKGMRMNRRLVVQL